jgi:transcriptional regulator with XRE-family HTH domain
MWNQSRAKELIEEKGRTRKWVAEQCRITVESLSQILNGRTPSRPVVALMAQALDVDESELWEGE